MEGQHRHHVHIPASSGTVLTNDSYPLVGRGSRPKREAFDPGFVDGVDERARRLASTGDAI